MKNRKNVIIMIILVLVLFAAAIAGLLHSCKNQQEAQESIGMVLDDGAEPYEPAESLASDGENGIAIPGYSTIYFPANETEVQLTLYNPEKNTCLFRFELYIDEETEPIASTGLIEPGNALRTVALSRPLKAGEYTLNIKVLPFTADTYAALNNALVHAELCVVGDE